MERDLGKIAAAVRAGAGEGRGEKLLKLLAAFAEHDLAELENPSGVDDGERFPLSKLAVAYDILMDGMRLW